MLKQTINIAVLIGIAFLGLSCGNKNKQSALEQCQQECEERLNNPECRIGGGRICLCQCTPRGVTQFPSGANLRLAENNVSSIGLEALINDQSIYSGLRTPAQITEINATEIASSVWIGCGKANEVTVQDNSSGGSPDHSDLSMNISLRDNSSGKAYLLEDYRLSLHTLDDYTDINIVNGKFYDPNYGYVDVSTTVPLRIDDTEAGPSSGVLVATGENDSTLTMRAFSDAVYQVVFERKQ